MNPFFSKEMADQHIRDLRREAAKGRAKKRRSQDTSLTVRLATLRDSDALMQLAALDEAPLPRGQVLVAQVGNHLVAGLPLDGGRAFADPFRRTAQFVELLELRARQLRDQDPRRSRTWRFPRMLRAA